MEYNIKYYYKDVIWYPDKITFEDFMNEYIGWNIFQMFERLGYHDRNGVWNDTHYRIILVIIGD